MYEDQEITQPKVKELDYRRVNIGIEESIKPLTFVSQAVVATTAMVVMSGTTPRLVQKVAAAKNFNSDS
jgi:hypothetical protein